MGGSINAKFEALVAIVKRLRAPDGCPWDREQTSASLLPFFLEEAYEVVESVDEKNWSALQEELGDILLHVLFQADIAEEQGQFELAEVIEQINAKLIRRHPHVFSDTKAKAAFHARQNWEAVKHGEKKRASRLDGVPQKLPSLIRAQRLQQKASYVGFDWDKVDDVWAKIQEEIRELKAAQANGSKEQLEEEIGDVLFAVVNLARFLNISAEAALRQTNKKFIHRFKQVEAELKRRQRPLEEATLKEMDAIWNSIKQAEKAAKQD